IERDAEPVPVEGYRQRLTSCDLPDVGSRGGAKVHAALRLGTEEDRHRLRNAEIASAQLYHGRWSSLRLWLRRCAARLGRGIDQQQLDVSMIEPDSNPALPGAFLIRQGIEPQLRVVAQGQLMGGRKIVDWDIPLRRGPIE